MRDVPKNTVFLDVRNTWEYKKKHLQNSILVPFNKLPYTLEKAIPDKQTPVYIFCSANTRAKVAMKYMLEHGYKNIIGCGTIEDAEKL